MKGYLGFALEPKLSTPHYPIEKALLLKSDDFTVNKYLFTALRATSKASFYQGLTSNCVNWASLCLWLNGIPNIGIHPFLLHASMYLYTDTNLYNTVMGSMMYNY